MIFSAPYSSTLSSLTSFGVRRDHSELKTVVEIVVGIGIVLTITVVLAMRQDREIEED